MDGRPSNSIKGRFGKIKKKSSSENVYESEYYIFVVNLTKIERKTENKK